LKPDRTPDWDLNGSLYRRPTEIRIVCLLQLLAALLFPSRRGLVEIKVADRLDRQLAESRSQRRHHHLSSGEEATDTLVSCFPLVSTPALDRQLAESRSQRRHHHLSSGEEATDTLVSCFPLVSTPALDRQLAESRSQRRHHHLSSGEEAANTPVSRAALPKVDTNCTTVNVTRFTASLRTDNCPQPKKAQPPSHALTFD
jgi:hypothetical protein